MVLNKNGEQDAKMITSNKKPCTLMDLILNNENLMTMLFDDGMDGAQFCWYQNPITGENSFLFIDNLFKKEIIEKIKQEQCNETKVLREDAEIVFIYSKYKPIDQLFKYIKRGLIKVESTGLYLRLKNFVMYFCGLKKVKIHKI